MIVAIFLLKMSGKEVHELSIRPITCFSFNKDNSGKLFFHFRSEPTVSLHRFKLAEVVVSLSTFEMVSLNLRFKETSEAILYDQGL